MKSIWLFYGYSRDTPRIYFKKKQNKNIFFFQVKKHLRNLKICVIVNANSLGNEAEASILKLVTPEALNKVYVVINKADNPNKRGKG